MSGDSNTFVILGGTGFVGRTLVQRLTSEGARADCSTLWPRETSLVRCERGFREPEPALCSEIRSNVFVGARNQTAAAELQQQTGCEIAAVEAEQPQSIEDCIAAAAGHFGHVDGVANCIGSVLLKPGHLTSDAEWQQTLTVNLTSAFATLKAAVKVLRSAGGSIVLVSSAAARIGLANHEAIAAAKAGILGLTLAAAATYGSRGIRVNAIAPGLVKSEMTRSLWQNEAAAATSRQMHALGRLGEPDDIASAIHWLLSDASGWVTGQTIGVDGGLGSVLTRVKA